MFHCLHAAAFPFALCALFAASPAAHTPYVHAKSYFESRVDVSEPERARIRKHLARVEADLRAHPPAGLSPAQAEARKRRLDDLHAYRLRGEFPRNRDFPDSLVPYFIDDRGIACAVGHLVIASGHRGFAEHIRLTQNHAYIREIADPRLSQWAEASGLTLEECARIQPGYGGPVPYPYIREMEVSPDGAVWTLAGPSCMCSPMYFQAFSLHPGGAWQMPFPQFGVLSMLCLDPEDRPLIGVGVGSGGASEGLLWNGRLIGGSGYAGSQDCSWSPEGPVAFVAGNSGLRSYRLTGSELGLMSPMAPSESMQVVSATSVMAWSGSNRGAFGRGIHASGSLTRLDSAGKAVFRVTGLASQGTLGLWAGINGSYGENPAEMFSQTGGPVFSREGLFFRRGLSGGWTGYSRALSGLPSDTILALTPADSQSVWIATTSGIFRFTPPGTATQVRPGFNSPVTDLATDSLGRLYIATWGSGVYRWHDGITQTLGHYSTSSSLYRAGRGREADKILRRQAPGPEDVAEVRSLLGRRSESARASGLYILPAARR